MLIFHCLTKVNTTNLTPGNHGRLEFQDSGIGEKGTAQNKETLKPD